MLALAYPISMKHVLRSKYDATILALALPALGALAADPLVSLVDTAFVGRLGTTPLAALGINAALFNMAFFVFTFLAYGATPLISHALARGDSEAAGRTAAQALLLALTLGIGVSAVLLIFAQPLVRFDGRRRYPVGTSLRLSLYSRPGWSRRTSHRGGQRDFSRATGHAHPASNHLERERSKSSSGPPVYLRFRLGH